MILTFADGRRSEAILLARTENKIRVAIPGSDDPLEFTDVHGTWVSEDCEPVRVQFAWEKKTPEELLSEADCVCSHDLAARLLHLLRTGDSQPDPQSNGPLAALETDGIPAAWREGMAN
jgi:hypothetical protein